MWLNEDGEEGEREGRREKGKGGGRKREKGEGRREKGKGGGRKREKGEKV